jgi:hypothetical protein
LFDEQNSLIESVITIKNDYKKKENIKMPFAKTEKYSIYFSFKKPISFKKKVSPLLKRK